MSSLRERLSTAIRVFREDPDSVVLLSSDGPRGTGEWTAKYGEVEHTGNSEHSALGSLYVKMRWVRDSEFREAWSDAVDEVVSDE